MNRIFLLYFLLAGGLFITGCQAFNSQTASPDPSCSSDQTNCAAITIDWKPIASKLYTQLQGPALVSAVTLAEDLVDATQRLASDGATAVTNAQAAYTDAFLAWQIVESQQWGYVAAKSETGPGLGLADRIYSWPSVNPCRIDQELVKNQFQQTGFSDSVLVNVLGYDALEYVLFYSAEQNNCSAISNINADNTWDSNKDVIQQRRYDYAVVVAQDIASLIRQLSSGGSPVDKYASQQALGDALYQALFYVEKTIKDLKIGQPSGFGTCTSDTCIDAVETPWSGISGQAVLRNLQATKDLIGSADSNGFYQALVTVGQQDVAQRLLTNLDRSIELIEKTPDFASALQSNPKALISAYEAVKAVGDILKQEAYVYLSLNIPAEGAGDAD